MLLEGSCNCTKVSFSCEADGPVPFMRCYCSFCRKTGGGGYMVNLLAKSNSLKVEGMDFVKIHRAPIEQPDGSIKPSHHQRLFCGECGSHLWSYNPEWPDLIHPLASAIDTELPKPPSSNHIFMRSKASWLDAHVQEGDETFETYPNTSLEDWHKKRGLYDEGSG